MNSQTAIASTILKQSDLSHLSIVNLNTAEELGRVSNLWLNLNTHKVESMTCKASWLSGTTHTFNWSRIDTIGKNSGVVQNRVTLFDEIRWFDAVIA